MARGLTSAVKTELATGIIEPVLLLEIGFGTPVYLTNASFDITSSVSGSSRTYLANGHLKSITDVSETNKPTKNTLAISLSGVDQTYISVALNENIINDDVYIYRGFLNSSLSLIADPFLLFFGTIDEFNIKDNTTTSSIALTVTSHWGNFSKISGRTTTDNSQQRVFSGDKGMEFSALTVKDIKWGRV
jgi:Na+-transporting methylmalonyl-CoA/oxaloacetate decarboxylase beta subunit